MKKVVCEVKNVDSFSSYNVLKKALNIRIFICLFLFSIIYNNINAGGPTVLLLDGKGSRKKKLFLVARPLRGGGG